ncbi:MAG: hypothetical protein C0501_29110 [Isosphaera sp.]|nr:hypothetical protein [Isosphaera sp.]
MIVSPRKSVTRFFIPLIDVLILLFCMFLLLPFVSDTKAPAPVPKDKMPKEEPLPADVKVLQELLREEKLRVARLERERASKLTDRLAVRVLEIDPKDGTLFYYAPNREDIRSDADAERLILRHKTAAGEKDPFFLILFPRTVSNLSESQIAQMRRWFKDVPYGFDIP